MRAAGNAGIDRGGCARTQPGSVAAEPEPAASVPEGAGDAGDRELGAGAEVLYRSDIRWRAHTGQDEYLHEHGGFNRHSVPDRAATFISADFAIAGRNDYEQRHRVGRRLRLSCRKGELEHFSI